MAKTYDGFWDFYPFYLSQHLDRRCRVLHYIGTSLGIAIVVYAIITGRWSAALLAPVAGYAFAWAGHFFFEKNRPATFTYPLMSLQGDFVMLFQAATGRLRLPDGPPRP
jgi:hypothetical protein